MICCFKDEIYTHYHNKCYENTCANVRNPPKYCTKSKHQRHCVCRKHLYRNEHDECVPIEQCRNVSEPREFLRCPGQNEELIGCYDEANARICPEKGCSKQDNIFRKPPKSSHKCILNKCDCIEGFLRNIYGNCVPEKDCHNKYKVKASDPCPGLNEVRVKHIKKCDIQKCANLRHKKRKCRGDGARYLYNICICAKGYWRDDCGRCIPKNQCHVPCKCTNPSTDPNKDYQFGNDCLARTCENLWLLPLKLCLNTGYYRWECSAKRDLWENEEKECVPRDKCPPSKNDAQPIE